MDQMESLRSGSRVNVVVGLGNPYRTDDGVGIAVVRALKGNDALCVTAFWESAHDSVPLAQALIGFERALIVDATPFLPVGEVVLLPIHTTSGIKPNATGSDHRLRVTDHRLWLHGLGLAQALELLSAVGMDVPMTWALAIGVPPDPPFGGLLSPEVAAAVPKAIEKVEEWLRSAC